MREVGEYNPNDFEKDLLEFWRENKTFEKSVERRRGSERFVFLEGPPTANGKPGAHHVIARTTKDVICRYKTMKGFLVERKGGWDTHGLPVELEIEKELGLNSKKEIEEYGIARFNEKCRESVFRYEREWRKMTERMAFWIDMKNPYITLKNEYIESVWWSLKEIWKKGLLYKGHRVVPYCPRCGTPLSSHEVAQGYKDVTETSVIVKFKLKEREGYILAWTTTPWTLPGNVALAVGEDISYLKVRELESGEVYYLAEDLKSILEGDYEVLEKLKGEEIAGWEYEPLYPVISLKEKKAYYVAIADFVSTEEGTGVVHTAVMYGEDDYNLGLELDLPRHHTVDEEGKFTSDVKQWEGRFVKDVENEIVEDLKKRGLLYKAFPYTHTYPFCWRCDTPLLYYARDSWFIGMRKVRKNLLKNNDEINWYPSHLKYGRFGNFLEDVRDWALSRERFWGTPLPIWRCKRKHLFFVGSLEELESMVLEMPENLDLHRPFIDEVYLKCPECGKTMRRLKEVIDVWYDSGAAPFAQWHYPFENQKVFRENFPADYISEAVDQTRGWFYSLLAESTLLFDKPAYKNILSTGMILGEDGVRMSTSRRTAVDPWEIFQIYGADSMRFYLLTTNAPWDDTRFYKKAVEETHRRFMMTLWNVYSFFVTYALIDEYEPQGFLNPGLRSRLDRYILSRLNSLIRKVEESMDTYQLHKASRAIDEFVREELSNWYVRRSRRRFWKFERDRDKKAAYDTLYEVLVTLSKLLAPLTPFIAEGIYLNLRGNESVHLQDFPEFDEEKIDLDLEKSMRTVLVACEAGRAAKAFAKIKLRQPVSRVLVVCSKEKAEALKEFHDLILSELNAKEILFKEKAQDLMVHSLKPNYKSLGPKFKDRVSEILRELEKVNPRDVFKKLEERGRFFLNKIELTGEDIQVIQEVREGFSLGESKGIKVFVETTLTPELLEEGLVRDIVRRVQNMRKELDLDYKTEIELFYNGDSEVVSAMKNYSEYIKNETLASSLENKIEKKAYEKTWKIGDRKVYLGIKAR
ncbi:MAG: isoleucine--tRNA ligase [Candidatus Methanofastidiosia archaeon]